MKYILFFLILLLPVTAEARIDFLKAEINRLRGTLFELYLQRDLSSESYVVVNLSTEKTVASKNIEKHYPIASITKMMSAIVAIENINLEDKITLTSKMLEPYGYSPSLFLGLNVSAENLLKATLIQSTNDAAEALTFFLEEKEFLRLMNKKAKEIGMENTFFYDAHGLSYLNCSTALDLAKLIKYIKENHPQILEITKDDNFWLPDHRGVLLKFKNVNNFYSHPDFIGAKTGYLPAAKQTFLALVNFNDGLFAIVLLYSPNRQKDTEEILKRMSNLIPI